VGSGGSYPLADHQTDGDAQQDKLVLSTTNQSDLLYRHPIKRNLICLNATFNL
jgi:hypothetical protein